MNDITIYDNAFAPRNNDRYLKQFMIKKEIKPRVSIVLCTFRGTAFLKEQIQSFLQQTLQPYEVIVCDDHSGDGTVSILEDFQKVAPFPVHIFVNDENLGSSRNFDKAMQLATGDFLALSDQDDVWMPQKLEILAQVLAEHAEVGGVFSDALLIDGHGQSLDRKHGMPVTLWQLHGFNARKQASFIHGNPIDLLLKHDVVTGATMMVRNSLRSLWQPIPRSWVHDGWMTWMLAIQSKLALVEQPLIEYRIHSQQQLGIGGVSRLERIKQRRTVERKRYASVAKQFEDLRQRVLTLEPVNRNLDHALQRKVALLERRSRLPGNFVARILYVGIDFVAYFEYARGWRSLLKDLLL